MSEQPLSHSELLQLKRWNTPTIYNGWEQLTQYDAAQDGFNLEETIDFMPQMGAMVGYAVTVVIEPSESRHRSADAWERYREYVGSQEGPKICVVQDLDGPRFVGSFWGEVNSNTHRALGCVGTITDGCIRDVDEMTNAGFKAIARRLCVGHAHSCPVEWGRDVVVFGQKIQPGQLVHADKHGFLAIPFGEEQGLLDAAVFMDRNECETVISAARGSEGMEREALLEDLNEASQEFRRRTEERFRGTGEW